MPHAKMKLESYQNLGGMNLKASPYLTGPQEFLNLVNFDFQTPGSLTKRWGSTQYLLQSYTGQIQSFYEYNKLDGSSYLMFGVSGGIWFGATNGQLLGISMSYQSATFLFGTSLYDGTGMFSLGQGYELDTYMGQPTMYGSRNQAFVEGIAQAIIPMGITFSAIQPSGSIKRSNLSSVSINNYVFSSDGSNFFKYDGITTSFYGVPPAFVATPQGGPGHVSLHSGELSLLAGFDYAFAYTLVNRRGFEGPFTFGGVINQYVKGGGPTLGAGGFTLPVYIPKGYDINSVNMYMSYSVGVTSLNVSQYPTTSVSAFNRTFYSIRGFTFAAGSSYCVVSHGASWTTVPGSSSVLSYPTHVPSGQVFKGITYATAGSAYGMIYDPTLFVPKYLEIYNNQLMMAGFSGSPSTVWFSEVGEPEAILPENNFEVRTNDGDVVTAMKAFTSNLMVFKTNSYHQLSGQDPQNFSLRQVSDQYGCLNHRCTAVYDDFLVFLDRKGIVRFNGANQDTVSSKIQSVFERMNVSAAKDTACMVHDKKRNQILTAIPVDGAAYNNLTVVYDYLVDGWTTYEGFNPSLFLVAQGKLSERAVFYGGYTGQLFNMGASYFGDNGVGYTCLVKTRYMSELGQSVEKQYRRLHINVDPVTSSTSSFNIVMYPNYGTTVGFTSAMYANPFQSRIDFGLSARSLAFELSNNSASDSVKLHGYVLEYRMQRNV